MPVPDLMDDAMFVGFVQWLAGEPMAVQAFREDTGCEYRPPASGIDRLIDEATGATEGFAKMFVAWASELWGDHPA